jgi:hypothetical protein
MQLGCSDRNRRQATGVGIVVGGGLAALMWAGAGTRLKYLIFTTPYQSSLTGTELGHSD